MLILMVDGVACDGRVEVPENNVQCNTDKDDVVKQTLKTKGEDNECIFHRSSSLWTACEIKINNVCVRCSSCPFLYVVHYQRC